MKVRILTSIGIAVFGLPLLFLSEYIVYPIAVALLAAVAIFEMSALTGMRRNLPVSIPAYLLALALPIAAYFASDRVELFVSLIFALLAVYMFYLFGYAVIKRGAIRFADLSAHLVTTAYIVISFTSLSMLRYIPRGVYLFSLVFVASWVCDVFAYFVGRAIGRHKLIPEVSPKKTVEGAIGGVVFTTGAFALYGYIVTLLDGPSPNYIALLIFGLVLSVVAQFGDLIASLIKREHGIKDYGFIFPGHGGVLDRFDSIIAVAPVLLMLCLFFAPFK